MNDTIKTFKSLLIKKYHTIPSNNPMDKVQMYFSFRLGFDTMKYKTINDNIICDNTYSNEIKPSIVVNKFSIIFPFFLK